MKRLSIFFLLCAICLLHGCKGPDQPCQTSYVYEKLRDYELVKVPYTDSSVITFINANTNDTHNFYAKGWDSSATVYDDSGPKHNCPYFFVYESKKLVFESSTYGKSLSIQLHMVHGGLVAINIVLGVASLTLSTVLLSTQTMPKEIVHGREYSGVTRFGVSDHTNNPIYDCYYNLEFGILKITQPGGDLELLKLKK
ncbi:MAG: hypothetical protein H7296_11845 [Bacteroidia bacterium]|nr:hypothetical protein [Bacteroidia bacterium]